MQYIEHIIGTGEIVLRKTGGANSDEFSKNHGCKGSEADGVKMNKEEDGKSK